MPAGSRVMMVDVWPLRDIDTDCRVKPCVGALLDRAPVVGTMVVPLGRAVFGRIWRDFFVAPPALAVLSEEWRLLEFLAGVRPLPFLLLAPPLDLVVPLLLLAAVAVGCDLKRSRTSISTFRFADPAGSWMTVDCGTMATEEEVLAVALAMNPQKMGD